MDPGARRERIDSVLRAELGATHVEIVDHSERHAGHPGAVPGAGNLAVLVVSPRFEGLSRLDAQRLVYGALAELMESEIHALQMRTLTPEAWEAMRQAQAPGS